MEPETVKLLKEIPARMLLDIVLGNYFLLNHIPPSPQVTKPKINEGDKKNFCGAKTMIMWKNT